ncbi:hemagglutinin/amebocyte aggregation factor-like isoform X4 [Carcharodon carcharias]|uniref:hemagglutinin/amebocyte aggregation factor-like isoform X4 n=1 Tax=Carcharodon carcharias TaxID=13397 RepID=UPI001B7D94C2|nr:hemagglutinin/amebocyte aggregation factor-like isoform X4 [Carcharodon carcharias]
MPGLKIHLLFCVLLARGGSPTEGPEKRWLVDNMKSMRWKFYCCEKWSVCYTKCNWTQYINESNEYFSWQVPEGFYLVGAIRYHDNVVNKRRWQYRYCAMFPVALTDY